jgi:hypothetical protein
VARCNQILLLFMLLSPCGCAEEVEGPAGGFRILTTQPPDGSAAVPETVIPSVLFNKEIPEQMNFDMTLFRGGMEEEIRCAPGEDTSVLECTPEEPLRSAKIYRLLADLDLDGEPESETMFSTALPRGPAFDIGQQLVVERVGNSDSAPDLLELALVDDQTTMVVVFNEFKLDADALPSDGYMLLGMAHDRPFATEEGEIVADGEFGYVISAPGTVQSDGGFLAEVEYAYMPLLIGGEPHQLLLRSLEIRGTVDAGLEFSHVTEVHAEAWIPVVALQDMIDALSEWGNVLDDMTNIIDPDLDTDLDDELDACLFRFSSAGARVKLVESKDTDFE